MNIIARLFVFDTWYYHEKKSPGRRLKMELREIEREAWESRILAYGIDDGWLVGAGID